MLSLHWIDSELSVDETSVGGLGGGQHCDGRDASMRTVRAVDGELATSASAASTTASTTTSAAAIVGGDDVSGMTRGDGSVVAFCGVEAALHRHRHHSLHDITHFPSASTHAASLEVCLQSLAIPTVVPGPTGVLVTGSTDVRLLLLLLAGTA